MEFSAKKNFYNKYTERYRKENKMNANNSIFYHIYPLGFCKNKGLDKITETIPHIKYLGCNALYLGPIFESVNHGYDTIDFFKIDRRLGDNEKFKEVSKKLHENDISIVLDGVFNHVGRDFWAFNDVKNLKGYSKYCDWFKLHWDCNNKFNDGFCYDFWEGCEDLVKLNLQNSELKNHIFAAIKFWIEEFQIDGLRLDVAYCLDKQFLKELHTFCKNLKSDFWLMGETLHGDYNQWMNPEMLDSVTNYACYKGLFSSCNDKNMFEIAHSLIRQKSLYNDKFLYNFLDNHDVSRLKSVLKDKRDLKLLYTLLFAMPGIPSIYYGSELGIEGDKEAYGDSVLRPYIDCFYGNDLTEHIAKLGALRKNHESLTFGDFNQIELTNEAFIFSRDNGKEQATIAINVGEKPFVSKKLGISLPEKSSHIFINNECKIYSVE